jgi:hypothetical protein
VTENTEVEQAAEAKEDIPAEDAESVAEVEETLAVEELEEETSTDKKKELAREALELAREAQALAREVESEMENGGTVVSEAADEK